MLPGDTSCRASCTPKPRFSAYLFAARSGLRAARRNSSIEALPAGWFHRAAAERERASASASAVCGTAGARETAATMTGDEEEN